MRKVLSLIVCLVLFVSLAQVSYVYAQEPEAQDANKIEFTAPEGAIPTNVSATNVPQLVINLIFGTAIFLAIVYLMFGGVRWITSRGDKLGVAEARKHIIAAIVGLVVVVGTFFIINLVFTLLGSDKNPLKGGFNLPTLTDPSGKGEEEPSN